MPKKQPTITLIGAGNLALALAPALRAAGYRIDEIVSRSAANSRRAAVALARKVGAHAVTIANARLTSDVVWFCVGDRDIAPAAADFAKAADWEGKIAFHSSGALTSDELDALRRRGAQVASLHPMMTFVRSSAPSLTGVGFAVEGDRAAVQVGKRLARDLGASVFAIRKSAKPLYHAWGAFGSPVVIMELALAERVARAAGIAPAEARRTIEPIVRRTIDNYFAYGAAASFSGPLVRGDVDTVRRHLHQLSRVPGAKEAYVSLVRSALRTLPVARKAEIMRLLK
ncbi:MAG: DUF2520 domain-containing protein [Terriglobales bacterium]